MRQRITVVRDYSIRLVNFWISLIGLASITAFVWGFDQIDYLSTKVVLNTASAVVSLVFLSDGFDSNPNRHKLSVDGLFLAAFSVVALVILILDRLDFSGWVLNAGSVLASLLPLLVYVKLAQGKRILKIWILPITLIALLYWLTLITPSQTAWNFLLLPLPVITCTCVAWGLATRWFLIGAARTEQDSIKGPGFESLAMLFLAAPLVVLTMLFVNALEVDDIWVVLSGLLIGVMFGNAIGDPFRRFLRALANLP